MVYQDVDQTPYHIRVQLNAVSETIRNKETMDKRGNEMESDKLTWKI